MLVPSLCATELLGASGDEKIGEGNFGRTLDFDNALRDGRKRIGRQQGGRCCRGGGDRRRRLLYRLSLKAVSKSNERPDSTTLPVERVSSALTGRR